MLKLAFTALCGAALTGCVSGEQSDAQMRAHAMFTQMAMTPAPQPQFSPVYTQPQVIYTSPQPTLTQTVNSTMAAQRY